MAKKNWKTIKPIKDTAGISEIRVFYCECTGSRDVDVDSGHLKMPDSLTKRIGSQPTMDISDQQWKLLFGSPKKSSRMYMVRGKIISVTDRGFEPKAGPRYIPFFDIYQYKLLHKELVLRTFPD